LPATRRIIDAILSHEILKCNFVSMPVFHMDIPTELAGVDSAILNPRNTWTDKNAYDAALAKLGKMFVDNFTRFADMPEGKALVKAGPQL
jgi:phosphoenolpyruvate carboxykinase (ATP)